VEQLSISQRGDEVSVVFTAEEEAEASVDPAEDLAELDSVVAAVGSEAVTSAEPVWVALVSEAAVWVGPVSVDQEWEIADSVEANSADLARAGSDQVGLVKAGSGREVSVKI
jgi:hypothetical protein